MCSSKTPETARERFARNLREKRLERGLSQEHLADLAGVHRTYVGSLERAERNVSIDSMERLASSLELDILDMLIPRSTR